MTTATPVLILTGPPGAGKTTAAGILAARSDCAVHLEADLFFNFIRSGYVEPWRPESHEQNELVMRIVGEAAAAYAAAGYFTIVDGIVIPRWYLGTLREVIAAAGLVTAYAVLRPALPTCISRIDAREGGPLAEPAVIEQLWDEFAELGEFERNVVDPHGGSATGVADMLGDLLSAGKLDL